MPVDGGVHNILGSKVWTEIVQEIKGNIREGVIYCHNFQAKKIHWFLAQLQTLDSSSSGLLFSLRWKVIAVMSFKFNILFLLRKTNFLWCDY